MGDDISFVSFEANHKWGLSSGGLMTKARYLFTPG